MNEKSKQSKIIEICNAFDRSAATYEQSAKVQREIGQRLLERLDYLNIEPQRILDVGCGPGVHLTELKKRFPRAHIVGLDYSLAMLNHAKDKSTWWHKWSLVNADMCQLPFASNQFDLIFSNQVVHWAPSFKQAMKELNRVLNINGCIMFSTLGPDTFQELRYGFEALDSYAHTNTFMDMHDVGDCLLKSKFLDPVVDMERLTAHYSTLASLLSALKQQGVPNIHPERRKGLMGKSLWMNFKQRMEALKQNNKVPLTYEVLYGHAWKSAMTQSERSGQEFVIPVNMLKKKTNDTQS